MISYDRIHLAIGDLLLIDASPDAPVLVYGSSDDSQPLGEMFGFGFLTGIGAPIDVPTGVPYIIEPDSERVR